MCQLFSNTMRAFPLDNARCLDKKIKRETIRRMDLCTFSNKTGKTESYFVGLVVVSTARDMKVNRSILDDLYMCNNKIKQWMNHKVTRANVNYSIYSFGITSETINVFFLDWTVSALGSNSTWEPHNWANSTPDRKDPENALSFPFTWRWVQNQSQFHLTNSPLRL
jgi:hypothetical protein